MSEQLWKEGQKFKPTSRDGEGVRFWVEGGKVMVLHPYLGKPTESWRDVGSFEDCIETGNLIPADDAPDPQPALDGLSDAIDRNNATIAELREQVAKLQAFKDYVHSRLDAAGVTVDPESTHKAEGCRIGGRLDEVFAERDRLTRERGELQGWKESAMEVMAPIPDIGKALGIPLGQSVLGNAVSAIDELKAEANRLREALQALADKARAALAEAAQ